MVPQQLTRASSRLGHIEQWLRSCAVIIDWSCCIPTHSRISHRGLQGHGGIIETGYEGVTVPNPQSTKVVVRQAKGRISMQYDVRV